MNKSKLSGAIALVAIAALHYWSVPRSIWEFDESLFAAAVERYAPLLHHPPPPGYPLYIAFAKIVALFTPDAFTALLVTSIVALAAGMLAFVLAFSAITDSPTAIAATALLYASPSMLISGTLPQSDTGAMALLALAIWGCVRAADHSTVPALCALLCALCIGWRLQLSIAVVPMFLAAVVMMRSWRDRAVAVSVFGLVCLAWFVPLMMAAGGPESYWNWLSGQARYYAQHDADLSRSGHSPGLIALRFTAHPWGPKWLSLPLLGVALLGIRRNRRLIPLACGALVYLAFALATMDPADAVRYALPSLPFIALLAATALVRVAGAWPSTALVALYAAGSFWYAFPVLHARATSLSPPAAAARWIRANVPGNGVIFYDAPLWPHATYLLRGYKSMRIDAGVARYGSDASTPIVLLTDGELNRVRGVTYRWPDTDAYRKLTRRHYGAVSVFPSLPERRFKVLEGVFAPERTRDGQSWRWLGARAVIKIPRLAATHVRLVFRTPPEYPLDGNRVRVNGKPVALGRNDTAEIVVPLPADRYLTLIPERTFVPARIAGANNRDRRTLSVMLTLVEAIDLRPAAAESPRPQ